jgi:predicted ribosome quality control (RQC) complex YloA/Tae2 family protein
MIDEDRLLLDDLKANIQQLFGEYEKLDTEKKRLENNVETLKNEIELLEQAKTELSKSNEQWEIANRILSGSEGNKEAKQKINRLIREIDKCIALLNK